MICVSSGFRCSLLFLALLVASQTLAIPGNSVNSTPISSTATKCSNMYNNFYAGPNKKIETLLQGMKKQLTHVEDDILFIKENKSCVKEPNKTEILLQEVKKKLTQVQDDINIIKGNQTFCIDPIQKIEALLQGMKEQLTQMQDDINILKGNKTTVKAKNNCAELYKSGQRISGVYTIDPDGSGAFDVFCDQTTDGGGWTVFQKRLDGSVDFYRGWADYKNGFGNLSGEFWLGLNKIYRLTNATKNKLRVDLEDFTGKTAYAEYDMFAVTSERTKYKLSLGSYSGTAGDSLTAHRGYPFTTKDQDNDGASSANCAVEYKGAWWYESCHHSNLNGLYHHGAHSSYADGINWYHWKGYNYSAKRAEMKIRPVNF